MKPSYLTRRRSNLPMLERASIDIAHIALVFREAANVFQGPVIAHVTVMSNDSLECRIDVLGHATGITANVEVSTGFQPVPQLCSVLA